MSTHRPSYSSFVPRPDSSVMSFETHSADESEDANSWAGDFDPLGDPAERKVLFAAFDSFRLYRRTAHRNTTHRRRQAFYALPSAHWQMLAEPPFSILENFNKVDDAIDKNADIANAILSTGLSSFGIPALPDIENTRLMWHDYATSSDVNKAHSTIRQFYRDWSAEGKAEREACYTPVLQALEKEFPKRRDLEEDIRVLVPGAGLGRSVFEICRAGFAAEGNEISYHQLLASSWVLNHTSGPKHHELYPFALHFSNLLSREQQLRKVMIPDVHPGATMLAAQAIPEASFGAMSMSAADFVVLYNSPEQKDTFDAVATIFFIDTAPNLIRYIEAIRHCLKPNGIWINVGPLLWHFEAGQERSHHEDSDNGQNKGIGEPGSVELTEEEVFYLIECMGFKIEKRQSVEERAECGYIQDPDSMLQPLYRPSHWIARKRRDSDSPVVKTASEGTKTKR